MKYNKTKQFNLRLELNNHNDTQQEFSATQNHTQR